jgi:hypothetical protein
MRVVWCVARRSAQSLGRPVLTARLPPPARPQVCVALTVSDHAEAELLVPGWGGQPPLPCGYAVLDTSRQPLDSGGSVAFYSLASTTAGAALGFAEARVSEDAEAGDEAKAEGDQIAQVERGSGQQAVVGAGGGSGDGKGSPSGSGPSSPRTVLHHAASFLSSAGGVSDELDLQAAPSSPEEA